MSSDSLKKREMLSAYKVQVVARTMKNTCFVLLLVCFVAFIYIEILNNIVPPELVQEMKRLQNSSKVKLLQDLPLPDVDKNLQEIECNGPCWDNGNDEILDTQQHLEKLIQDVDHILTPYGKEVLTYDIGSLKIYIYDLPPKYNSDLASCAVQNRANSMCFDFANSGFGSGIDINVELSQLLRFYKTHQFSLEVIFHQKMLKSPYLTKDPTQADLFYIPFYVGLSCFCGADMARNLSSEFWSTAANLTYLNSGKIHFMALGKTEQEMSSERCPFLRNDLTALFKYLMIERTVSVRSRKYFLRYGKEEESIVVPYPSYGHFDSPYVEIPGNANRTIAAMMAGSMKGSDLRKLLRKQLQECDSCKFYQMNQDECYNSVQNVGKRIVALMTKSIFCFHPPGDTPTRKSFYDGILAGCIPVIFLPNVKYPFDELFNYNEFSVYIFEEELLSSNNTHIVYDILNKIPQDRIIQMQNNLAVVARFLQYGSYGFGDDAYTTALRMLLHASS